MATNPTTDRSKTYFGTLQADKVAQVIKTGILETPDTTAVYVDEKNGDEFVTKAHGETVPTDTEAGFAKGCEFLDTNTVDGTNPIYINVGDEEECEFVQVEDSLGVNDEGSVMKDVLRVASDVVSAETVTIGSDVYEVEIVNTDSTDDTANGDFNNTTNPLEVVDAVTRYTNITFEEGMLIRIQNEILRVTEVSGDDVTFARSVSGTTNATHANGQNMFVGDGIAGGSTIAVGLVTTLTPAVFTPALVDDINTVGTEDVKATSLQSGAEMLLESADAPGGMVVPSNTAIAVSETLGGADNAWASATMVSGKAAGARQVAVFNHTVLAVEVALNVLRLPLPFTPVGFIVQVRTSAGVLRNDLSDAVTISGNRIEFDFGGSTNLQAGDIVSVYAWN